MKAYVPTKKWTQMFTAPLSGLVKKWKLLIVNI